MDRKYIAHLVIAICILLFVVSPGILAAAPGDNQTFDLTPVALPTPSLKYELLFDPIDQTTGNAADYYQQARALLSDDLKKQIDRAVDTRNINTLARIDANLADPSKQIFDLLDKAGRCDHCDWQSHLREKGVNTALPYLNDSSAMANLVYVHAMAQANAGKPEDALATLRLGYHLARNLGTEQWLVNGLVCAQIETLMNRGLAQVIGRPDSPNLYWALAALPSCKEVLQNGMTGDRYWLTATIPLLQQARTRDLTAAEWQSVWDQLAAARKVLQPSNHRPARLANEDVLPAAQLYYSQTRNLPPEIVAKLDPLEVIGLYYFEHYEQIQDDLFKLVNLSYPQIQAALPHQVAQIKQLLETEPDNLLATFIDPLPAIPSLLSSTVEESAFLDRDTAALMTVEAIRAYTATNNGQLPQHLAEIIAAPVPVNPRTGKPFDYVVDGNIGVLSDALPAEFPLEFTHRIRH